MRVLICDDNRDAADMLDALMVAARYETCVCYDGRSCIEKARQWRAEVVLLDIGLPGMDGIEGIRILKERFPDLILLMHTVYDGDERIFDALCAGASGYLLKKTSPVRLLLFSSAPLSAVLFLRRPSDT